MIEEWRVQPLSFCMAIVALFAELAFMRLVLEMAGHAVGTWRYFENGLGVAVIAGDLDMRAV